MSQSEYEKDENENRDELSPDEANIHDDSWNMDTDIEFEDEAAEANDGNQQRIVALEEELARAKDHMLRALADAENARKRAVRDREDAGKYAVTAFARDLLDFADNFSRAMEAIPADIKDTDERVSNVVSGIEAMEKELQNTFSKHGITKIEPRDEPFDPHFHEVMFEAPGTGKPAGTIIQLVEAGYMIHDRLLRPARVGVAKGDSGNNSGPGNRVDTEA